MYAYKNLLKYVRMYGDDRDDRTGVGTISCFAPVAVQPFELNPTVPLCTLKRVPWRKAIVELLWFFRGGTNVEWLHENNVHIWDEWADENGDLGPVYGAQWRNFGGDQLASLEEAIRYQPTSRRLILSAWNCNDLARMALPPCPVLAQFYVRKSQLDCQVYQRSADLFLGVPWDIFEYAVLTKLMAHRTGLIPGRLYWAFGDAHIYKNHVEQVDELLTREPRPAPYLDIDPQAYSAPWEKLEPWMFTLYGYNPHPAIKGKVAV